MDGIFVAVRLVLNVEIFQGMDENFYPMFVQDEMSEDHQSLEGSFFCRPYLFQRTARLSKNRTQTQTEGKQISSKKWEMLLQKTGNKTRAKQHTNQK